ncbi:MAG TPA: SRPBCC domain-containing protein [Vicinamibacterales bacterium]|nr:SRPBCC domain-containing protein [Vicinamibacterales bacterium]
MTRQVACALLVLTVAAPAAAQNHAVRVEKIAAPEKMLRFEVTVPATVDEVWKAFTTREGVKTWLWPDARIDVKPGGDWYVLAPDGATAGGGAIVSVDPPRRIVISALAPEKFPTVRSERTRATFEFAPASPGGTIVTLVQTGWKTGPEWDAAYEYLAVGNAQLLAQLRWRFESGPIDWTRPAAMPAPVRLTSYASASGDRVLRHEVEVNAPPSAVWKAFTTSEGLHGFVAPIAAIDFKLGGIWEASYDPKGHLGDPGNILNEIISYVPERMLSIRVARTPPGFAHSDVAKAVWTVIEITDLGQGRSRVSTSMCGWKTGPDWDAVYAFFEQGNTIVSEHLRDYLNKGR